MTTPVARVTADQNQLGHVTLENAEGRQIVLYGMMHVGPQSYWNQVNIDMLRYRLTGFRFHFERVGLGDNPRFSAKDIIKLLLMVPSLRMGGVIAKQLKWVSQNDALIIFPDWENHDTDIFTAFRHVRMRDALKMGLVGPLLPLAMRQMTKSPNTLFDKLVEGLEGDGAVANSAVGRALSVQALLDDRNAIAHAAAMKTPDDLVLVWGAAHLPGLVDLFKGSGFTIKNQGWTLHSMRAKV